MKQDRSKLLRWIAFVAFVALGLALNFTELTLNSIPLKDYLNMFLLGGTILTGIVFVLRLP